MEAALEERLVARAEAEGVRARRVPVDYASHSSDVEVLEEDLRRLLADVTPLTGDVPMLSTVSGRYETAFDADYWYRNLREPVRFADGLQALTDVDAFVEVSAHPVLVPVIDEGLRARLRQIVDIELADTVLAWELSRKGHWRRVAGAGGADAGDAQPTDAQERLSVLETERARSRSGN